MGGAVKRGDARRQAAYHTAESTDSHTGNTSLDAHFDTARGIGAAAIARAVEVGFAQAVAVARAKPSLGESKAIEEERVH